MQAPMFDGFSFDPFALFDDGFSSSEVGIGGRDVVQAFMIALMVVMFDERLDLGFKVAGQIVILQQDAVFEGLVPTFDLALGLWMERRTANMAHAFSSEEVSQFACDIAGAIIAKQPWLVQYMHLIAA